METNQFSVEIRQYICFEYYNPKGWELNDPVREELFFLLFFQMTQIGYPFIQSFIEYFQLIIFFLLLASQRDELLPELQ